MAVTSAVDLLLALERGHFDAILNSIEAEYLDFKEAPYLLNQPHQRWELAKDVAAFANAQGGAIVIGYRTDRPENALVDLAVEHRPVRKDLINWDAYRQTLASWVYPHLEGLAAYWFPADPTVDRGVFVLVVAAQQDAAKYFVVRELDRPDGSFPGALGIPIRQGDAVSWLRPEAIQALVREALSVRRGGAALPAAVDRATVIRNQLARLEERCMRIESRADWTEVPFIAFHAIPNEALHRPDDFYGDAGLRAAIEHPDVLRETGFHIRTEAPVEVQVDGSLAATTTRRTLWLSPDGFLTAAGRADSELFGWYVNQGTQRPTAINPRVLTEYALEFARFFRQHVRALLPGGWSLWVSTVGLDRDGGVVLVPSLGGGGDLLQFWRDAPYERHQPLRPTAHARVEPGADAGDDAYRLLAELYALFGAPPDEIPFVDNRAISEARLLQEMRR